jgi:hypothetical protein
MERAITNTENWLKTLKIDWKHRKSIENTEKWSKIPREFDQKTPKNLSLKNFSATAENERTVGRQSFGVSKIRCSHLTPRMLWYLPSRCTCVGEIKRKREREREIGRGSENESKRVRMRARGWERRNNRERKIHERDRTKEREYERGGRER